MILLRAGDHVDDIFQDTGMWSTSRTYDFNDETCQCGERIHTNKMNAPNEMIRFRNGKDRHLGVRNHFDPENHQNYIQYAVLGAGKVDEIGDRRGHIFPWYLSDIR